MAGTAALDELTPHIDIEDFFINIVEATDSKGWQNVQQKFEGGLSDHDGRICFKFSTCGSCMTRLQFVVNTTLPAASLLSRPEVFSKPITGLTGFLHAEWLEQVSPGDAIVRISRQDAQEPLRRCSMRQILESPSCGYAAEKESEAHQSADWDAYFARMIVRSDIPRPGMAALLVLPLGRRHTVLFQVGPVRAYALTVQPHMEPQKVIVSNVMFLPFATYPTWATRHLSRLARLEKERFETHLQHSEELPRLLELDKCYYTILHLRACNRGPPLLPVCNDTVPNIGEMVFISDDDGTESCWERWTEQDFSFSLYCEEFLRRTKLKLKVYSEFNGRQLVPYQIAVCTVEWSACKSPIMVAFNRQQRAYRRLNGGVNAPRIGEANEARFQVVAPHTKKPCFASCSTDVVVRRTFLNQVDPENPEVVECSGRGWVPASNAVGGVLIRSSTAHF